MDHHCPWSASWIHSLAYPFTVFISWFCFHVVYWRLPACVHSCLCLGTNFVFFGFLFQFLGSITVLASSIRNISSNFSSIQVSGKSLLFTLRFSKHHTALFYFSCRFTLVCFHVCLPVATTSSVGFQKWIYPQFFGFKIYKHCSVCHGSYKHQT